MKRETLELAATPPGDSARNLRLDIDAVQAAYRRYAKIYDASFGPLMNQGRREAIRQMACQPGHKILEVGVGTGLSLPLYPHSTQLYGIDISPEMLARARQRAREFGLDNVADLQVMDAEHTDYADDSFDKVTAVYVASVVPDPVALVSEMRRVCKPDGQLYFLNHFHSTNPMLKAMEQCLSPFSRFLGFHPDLSLEKFVSETQLDVLKVTPTNYFGYWKLIEARNNKLDLRGGETSTTQTSNAA
jgi:phosphatidylethanolamine/phosphatidyl-N-methylethanolamine N-methyltransferase